MPPLERSHGRSSARECASVSECQSVSRQSTVSCWLSGRPPVAVSMRHDLGAVTLATVLIALTAVDKCIGLTCFYCTIHPPSGRTNQTAQLCSMFDHSNNYHIDCPYSTLCMKRTFELTLQQGKKVKVSERGCAPQKRNEQVYRDGAWHVENKIEGDVYPVGCEQEEVSGLHSPTKYCYCATNLCNSADSTRDYQSDTMAVIFIFNIIKYIQSLR